jgi:predicted DsbA family dithiol-disulfide isomerase
MMKIEVFADIACPWCYIGERRLRKALEARPEVAVDLRWKPFQLQPQLPPEGVPWSEFAPKKFGGWERARMMFGHVAQAGAADGIRFDFDRVATAANTRDAHRLVLFAEERGRAWEAAEALFAAYFAEGRDLGDREELVEIGRQAGLDAEELRAMLEGSEYVADVEESQAFAERAGITGVPFVIFDDRLAVSGAQPVELFVRAIDEAREASVSADAG